MLPYGFPQLLEIHLFQQVQIYLFGYRLYYLYLHFQRLQNYRVLQTLPNSETVGLMGWLQVAVFLNHEIILFKYLHRKIFFINNMEVLLIRVYYQGLNPTTYKFLSTDCWHFLHVKNLILFITLAWKNWLAPWKV